MSALFVIKVRRCSMISNEIIPIPNNLEVQRKPYGTKNKITMKFIDTVNIPMHFVMLRMVIDN